MTATDYITLTLDEAYDYIKLKYGEDVLKNVKQDCDSFINWYCNNGYVLDGNYDLSSYMFGKLYYKNPEHKELVNMRVYI